MPDHGRRMLAAGAALALAPLLAACGEDEIPDPGLPDPAETALWNPCDALDATFIRKQFGARTEEKDGTPSQPDCRFSPTEDSGDAVVTVNYQLFDGDLDQLWDAMGQDEETEVLEPRIKGSDGARVVVDAVRKQLYVTGFVQTGTLFQVVNVADPAPYDEEAVIAGVEATLARLAQHANEVGIGMATEDASESPSESATDAG